MKTANKATTSLQPAGTSIVTALPPRQLVDRYGELARKLKEAEARILQEVGVDKVAFEDAESKLLSYYTELAADLPAVAEGDVYLVKVKPREFKREFTPAARLQIFKELKKLIKNPLTLFGITLEAVKVNLGEPFFESVVTKERTGLRKLEPVAKASPAVPATA